MVFTANNKRTLSIIPVTLSPSDISASCHPKLLKGLGKFGGKTSTSLEIPVLLPKNMGVVRTNMEFTTEEQVEFRKLVSFVRSWLVHQFPAIPEDSPFLDRVAAEWSYLVPLLEPLCGNSMQSMKGKGMALGFNFVRFVDIIGDIPDLLPFDVSDKKTIIDAVKPIISQLQQELAETKGPEAEMHNILIKTMRYVIGKPEVHENPLIAMTIGAFIEVLEIMRETNLLKFDSMLGNNLYKAKEAQENMGEVEGKGLSFEAIHKIRGSEAGSCWMHWCAFSMIPEKYEMIPKELLDHSLVSHLVELQGQVIAAYNDILGIPKDLRNNDTTAPIFQEVVHAGCTLQEAVGKELEFLRVKLHDIIILEEVILEKVAREYDEKVRGAMESYFEVLEVFQIATLQIFQMSPMYSEGAQLDFKKLFGN